MAIGWQPDGRQSSVRLPVEECKYTAGFQPGAGQEVDPAEHSARLEILRAEHPNHTVPVDASNRKPKDVHTELEVSRDGNGWGIVTKKAKPKPGKITVS